MLRRDLSGSVAAVTGGARGIGLAIATELARSGAQVAIGDLDAELAAEQGRLLSGVGMALDVRDEASFHQFLDTVTRQLGPIDILVNNAGLAVIGDFMATSSSDQDLEMAVNLGGVVRGMRLALPSMVERGAGRIINIASAAGHIPAPGAAVYSATKSAVATLTEAVWIELRGTGVYVTAILPAFVPTGMAGGLHTRGVPRTSVERIAYIVVDILKRRRPPVSVTVPRWLAALALADTASPDWIRQIGRRIFFVEAVPDSPERISYNKRITRQARLRSGTAETASRSSPEKEG